MAAAEEDFIEEVENRTKDVHGSGLPFLSSSRKSDGARYAQAPGLPRLYYHASAAKMSQQREKFTE
jgi:hypothetical protein